MFRGILSQVKDGVMIKKRLFIFVLLVFSLFGISSALTLSVNGTGANCLVGTQNNYTTIQAAVNNATAGNTIYVCKNSTTGYVENVGINISLNVYGNQSGVGVIASSTSRPVFSVNATYVNITNFTLSGSTHVTTGFGLQINSTADSTYVYNVTSHSNTYGIYSGFTSIVNNTAYNNTYGFYSFSSGGNSTDNIAYNNTYGFDVTSTSRLISNNTAYNNTQYGVYVIGDSSNFTNNNVYNNSQYGFYFFSATDNNLSLNNATNNTLSQYQFDSNSTVTFTGINRALLTPSTGVDLNITSGSNVTTLVGSTYNNFTTSYGTIFFDNATNVTIKLMNLSDSGASSTGCSGFTGTCTLLTTSTNVVNISNASATGTIILGMYYDTSSSPTSSNLYIGKYVTANSGWQQVGQTAVDTANGTVRYGAITSFSTFGIVTFVASASTPSSDGTTVKSLEIDYDFTCSDGSLEVSTTKGAEVSLVELSPTYITLEKKEADSDGKALFTITEDGTYKIRATKSGYRSEDKDNLEFNLCEEETPEPELECTANTDCSSTEQCLNNECVLITGECGYASNHEFVSYECCSDSDCGSGFECTDNNCVVKTVTPPPDNSQSEALDSMNKAQQQLNKAKSEGKDITEAQKKLNEAKESYEEGDYEKVKQLLTGVQNLIKEPEEKPSEPTPEPKKPFDLLGLLLIAGSAVVVVVVLVGAYLFLKGGKSGGYKFKK